MKARVLIGAVVFLVACGSSSTGVRFPPGTPDWIRQDAIRLAKGMGDSHPTSVSIKRGPYTLVKVTGKFTCYGCSVPEGHSLPKGTVGVITVDAHTHRGRDFALCTDRTGFCNICA